LQPLLRAPFMAGSPKEPSGGPLPHAITTPADFITRPHHPGQALIITNFLPLGLLVVLLWALVWPQPGQATASLRVGKSRVIEPLNNAIVFFISGLTLRMEDFQNVLRQWRGLLYGLIAILLLTPTLALAARRLPLQPPEFHTGLAIFCIVPTTLGVGVAVTQVSDTGVVRSWCCTRVSCIVPITLRGGVRLTSVGDCGQRVCVLVLFYHISHAQVNFSTSFPCDSEGRWLGPCASFRQRFVSWVVRRPRATTPCHLR
jgi:uncharacterized membrane protein YhaH (DUF805 family)